VEGIQQRESRDCRNPRSHGEHHRANDPNISIQQAVNSEHSALFNSIPEEERLFSPAIIALAHEGTELDRKISNWCDSASLQPDPADPFTQLALAKYHAVRLFHCRNFTYYTCWHPGTSPQLDQTEIDGCVTAITDLCDKILHSSNIPGAILLFPLRMAGAHSKFEWQRNKVRNLLNQIHNSGFVVAERIQIDLFECWEFQDDQDNMQHGI
jgi:hypothetical protein